MRIDYFHWSPELKEQYNDEMIAWLQECYDRIYVKKEDLKPNPFYERNDLLTPELVHQVLRVIEDKCEFELKFAPAYHLRHNGLPVNLKGMTTQQTVKALLKPPEFDHLPYPQQLAIAQGMDRIVVKYRALAAEEAQNPKEKPPIYDGKDGC